MNKRDAKIAAYRRGASLIESELANGWFGLDDHYGEGDADKVRDALTEIVASLDARADRMQEGR